MPAWAAARYAGQTARNNHAPDTASDSASRALKFFLDGKFQRYKMENQCCFFCGARGHHTGYIPGYAGIWLCKSRCEDKYSEILRDL